MAAVIPKGCTAINTFRYPYTKTDTNVLYITYQQAAKTVLEFFYDEEDEQNSTVTFDEQEEYIYTFLQQEDTLKLTSIVPVNIQIRARINGDSAVKSNIVTATVDTILKGGVI